MIYPMVPFPVTMSEISDHPWRSNDTITDFQDGGSELCLQRIVCAADARSVGDS